MPTEKWLITALLLGGLASGWQLHAQDFFGDNDPGMTAPTAPAGAAGTAADAADPAANNPARPGLAMQRSGADALVAIPETFEQNYAFLDRALKFGLYNRADMYLDMLLQRPDFTPANLLAARNKIGSGLLVELQALPQFHEKSRPLIAMANQAALENLQDRSQMRALVAKLEGSFGEQAQALRELKSIGIYAVPVLIESYQAKGLERDTVIRTLSAMPKTIWPAVAALLDSNQADLMSLSMSVLVALDEPAAVYRLWFPATANRFPPPLRSQAQLTIARLLRKAPQNLPPAVPTLLQLAQEFYLNRVSLERHGITRSVRLTVPATAPAANPDMDPTLDAMPADVESDPVEAATTAAAPAPPTDDYLLWAWQENLIAPIAISEAAAHEYFGLRYARQVLELVPNNQQAQVVFLSIALDSSFQKVGFAGTLPADRNGPLEVAQGAGPEILQKVLAQALRDRKQGAALGAIQALVGVADKTLLQPQANAPSLLVQAMNYPEPRVQFAAVKAALELHDNEGFPNSRRLVQILAKAISSNPTPLAVVVEPNLSRGNQLAATLRSIGYEASVLGSGREAFRLAAEQTAVDLIFLSPMLRRPGLHELVASFQADARTAAIPLILLKEPANALDPEKLARRFPNVFAMMAFEEPEQLRQALQLTVGTSAVSNLTDEEKLESRKLAFNLAMRLARSEQKIFDLEPLYPALQGSLGDAELGPMAAQILGNLPAPKNQAELASVGLSQAQPLELRAMALQSLARNIQLGGVAVDQSTRARLVQDFLTTDDPQLRASLARVVGALQPTSALVAQRLRQFQPLQGEVAPITSRPFEMDATIPDTEPATPALNPTPAVPNKLTPAKPKSEDDGLDFFGGKNDKVEDFFGDMPTPAPKKEEPATEPEPAEPKPTETKPTEPEPSQKPVDPFDFD